jgi:hypothetical protein
MNKKHTYKLIILIGFIAYTNSYSDDYETAQRFSEGDTLSAEVLNDILDRIELSLKGITSSDLVGEWDVTQTTCNLGVDCWSFATTGFGDTQDSLIKVRSGDYVTFKDDGDGTYSYQTGSYCPFWVAQGTYADEGASSCTGKYIVGAKLIVFDGVPTGTGAYELTKISPSRYIMNAYFPSSSSSFNSIRLDKRNLSPDGPNKLTINFSRSSGSATLTWTAGDATETGYDVKRKNTAVGTYASIATPTDESYVDSSITVGKNYWYRVFATNANGTSIGSNVIQITYSNTPPSMNLASTISINEGTTEVVDVSATDADGDSMTYSITSSSPGNDASTMSITGGALSFDSAPDYEIPGDYDSNNIYDITISVSDGYDTASQDVSVVVLDVSD